MSLSSIASIGKALVAPLTIASRAPSSGCAVAATFRRPGFLAMGGNGPTSGALYRNGSAKRWGHERGEADEVVLWVVGIVCGLLLAGMGCEYMEMGYSYKYTGDPYRYRY